MSEPSHSSHRKLPLKIPKESQCSSPIQFSNEDSHSPNFTTAFIPNESFYNAFVGINKEENKSAHVPKIDRNVPVK